MLINKVELMCGIRVWRLGERAGTKELPQYVPPRLLKDGGEVCIGKYLSLKVYNSALADLAHG